MSGEPILGLLDLVGALRQAGVPASPDRVQALVRATDALGGPGPKTLYWAARLTLCGSPDEIARFDAAYQAYVLGERGGERRAGRTLFQRRGPEKALFTATASAGQERSDDSSALAVQASPVEVLRHRDLSGLSTVERAEVRQLLALLAPVAPVRPGRRPRPAYRGSIDTRRSARAMLHAGGEPARLRRRTRRPKPRRLVLLIDVSGSMAPYADSLLRFAHAAVRQRPFATEVFAFGTRLTRLTGPLNRPDPDAALVQAGALIPDWSGGTRLGEALSTFLREHGHRGMARRAVMVVFSDGWERGDPALLAGAAARLARLAHRVVWATPHAGRPGFAPVAGGLAAVLPHVDALLSGHSVAALEEIVKEISRSARNGGGSRA